MKAPKKCPMCGEKKKWIRVDKKKSHLNPTGAVVGAVAGSLLGPGALVGGLIGSAIGKGKKFESYCCGNCGFAHEYEA